MQQNLGVVLVLIFKPQVEFSVDNDYTIHFSVITKTREIIKVPGIPDFCLTGAFSWLPSCLGIIDSIDFKNTIYHRMPKFAS